MSKRVNVKYNFADVSMLGKSKIPTGRIIPSSAWKQHIAVLNLTNVRYN